MLKRFIRSIEYRLIQKTLKSKTNLEVKKIGDDYAFCFLPENFLNENSVFYSFGAGEDIFVEVELSKRYNCESHIFDPTPKSIEHFIQFKKKVSEGELMNIDRSDKRFYNIDKEEFKLLKYNDCGIWNSDTNVEFYLPENDNHVSCSIINIQNTDKKITVPVKTLKTIMQDNKHSKVDYLKIDIEGAEYDIIDSVLINDINMMYIEFHANFQEKQISYLRKLAKNVKKIKSKGYDLIHNYNNRCMTFKKK
jgi:FkbM family methyltransferase